MGEHSAADKPHSLWLCVKVERGYMCCNLMKEEWNCLYNHCAGERTESGQCCRIVGFYQLPNISALGSRHSLHLLHKTSYYLCVMESALFPALIIMQSLKYSPSFTSLSLCHFVTAEETLKPLKSLPCSSSPLEHS